MSPKRLKRKRFNLKYYKALVRDYLFSDYLEDGEEILYVCHRHPIVMLGDFLRISFFHALIPFAFWIFFPRFLIIYLIWAFIGLIRFFFLVQDWYYDAWLLTNMGIIGVEWTGFFDRTSSRVEYPSVEGVNYSLKGFWQTMLKYGDVTLAKFGGPSTITLKDAARPKRMEKYILKYQEKFMTAKNFQDQEVLKQLLADLVVEHVKKHGLPTDVDKAPQEAVKDR
jgi:hypothetical protein